MSSERAATPATACLALHLEGPLQAWGTESQYNRRTTALMPSKSAVLGMICAALGLERGSKGECDLLAQFASVPMLAVHVPRSTGAHGTKDLPIGRMVDFHTVQNTRKAEKGTKDCHITHRHYVEDGSFRVLLCGEKSLLERAAAALRNPVWGVWLGRKCCIPAAPVYAGLFVNEEEALVRLLPHSLAHFTHIREVADFAEGSDSLRDQPLSFLSADRRFGLRRVKYSPAKFQQPQEEL